MKHIKLFENYKSYKEIEFVCVNSELNSETSEEKQLELYKDLKDVEGLLPYIQDWSDEENTQKSLAVILLDNSLEQVVNDLAKKHNIKIDLINYVDDNKIDNIVSGRLENITII